MRLVLLYSWVASTFQILVPKKRGVGYLAVPYGHHHDPGLDQIAARAGVDVTGLDGALVFECESTVFYGGDAVRADFAAKVMTAVENHYGMTSREISESDFWRLHPLGRGKPVASTKELGHHTYEQD